MWCVVWCAVLQRDVECCELMWCVVLSVVWYEVACCALCCAMHDVWCVMNAVQCDVSWCDVSRCAVLLCDVLCCEVVWWGVM